MSSCARVVSPGYWWYHLHKIMALMLAYFKNGMIPKFGVDSETQALTKSFF